MRELLDTSVILDSIPEDSSGGAISTVTVAELRFGVMRAANRSVRRLREARLADVLDLFEPLPVDLAAANAWGVLAEQTVSRARRPRAIAFDLLIAATAQVHGLTLLTRDTDPLSLADVLDVRAV